MPFDGIVTKAITEELQDKIVNGRISKIYQPTETELVFTVRNQRTNYSLLLSIHLTYARFHLTKDKYENPQEPDRKSTHLKTRQVTITHACIYLNTKKIK